VKAGSQGTVELAVPEADKRIEVAGPWRLFWLKFRRHKVAVVSLAVILALYLIALLADFLAPFDPDENNRRYVYAPPQTLRFVLPAEDGGWRFRPHVYGLKTTIDPKTLARSFAENDGEVVEIVLFAATEPYLLAGFIPLRHRLIGPAKPRDRFYLLGADRLGRDMLSRMLHGTRFTVGLAFGAALLASGTGIALALLAAVGGRLADEALSRFMDTMISLPSKIFALVMVAAFGSSVPLLLVMAAITYVPGAFRIARALAVQIAALDYVQSARARGETRLAIAFAEILPNLRAPMLADFGVRFVFIVLLLAGLSFLGLGVQPPDADLGSLVRENLGGLSEAAPAVLVPAFSIASLTIGVNLLIDSLPGAGDRAGRG